MTFSRAARLPPQSATLAHQVQKTLEDMLCGGVLKPDDRTSIRELAELLGVSTMPVRDAVSRLTAQGALAIRRNSAVVVPRLGAADFEDLTEARILIEAQAVRKAVRRMTPDVLAELTALNDAFVAAMTTPGDEDAVALNQQFHFRLYEAAASPTLSRIIAGNWLRAGPMINLDLGLPVRRKRTANSIKSHAALLEALERRDEADAAEALTRDIRGTADFILHSILKTAENEEETA